MSIDDLLGRSDGGSSAKADRAMANVNSKKLIIGNGLIGRIRSLS
ncbi:MAG: hypothetical protein OSA95_12285 [Opitutales bacterium]|jgi:hypothetical protein|nr:hypothetical protein [Opitutales bacterium]